MDARIEAEPAAGAPDPLERAWRLASHLNDVDRHAEAEREARRGLALSPRHFALQIELARSQLGRALWNEADETVTRIVSVAPESPIGHQLMALVRAEQGRFAQAEAAILEALRLDPQWANAYEVYGDLMRRTDHLDKARKLYERARSLSPNDPDLPSKIALIEAEQNRVGRAHRSADIGLRLGPDDALAHASRGNAHLAGGRPFRARADFREALRIDPTNESLEAAWLAADTCCRVVYLPMYYWTLLIDRLPGKQFFVWGLYIAFIMGAKSLGVPAVVVGVVAFAYIAFCIYTWLATPLVKGWKKLVPPKL